MAEKCNCCPFADIFWSISNSFNGIFAVLRRFFQNTHGDSRQFGFVQWEWLKKKPPSSAKNLFLHMLKVY